jgi:hypothetical protein
MIKHIKMKRLALSTQTVRALDAAQLAIANGGAIGSFVYCSSGCGSGVPGCSDKCTSNYHLTCR